MLRHPRGWRRGGSSCSIANELVEVALPDGRTRRTEVGEQPHDATAGPDGRIFTADERGSTISEVRDGSRIRSVPADTQPPRLKPVGRVELPGSPYGLAVDGDRLWVTLTERNELIELQAGDEPKRLRSFPTVRQPNSVAVEPGSGRVFVASRADGTLQITDP